MQTYKKKIIHHDKFGFILEIQSCFSIFKSINLINYVNTLKYKNYMIISTNTGKLLSKSKMHKY